MRKIRNCVKNLETLKRLAKKLRRLRKNKWKKNGNVKLNGPNKEYSR